MLKKIAITAGFLIFSATAFANEIGMPMSYHPVGLYIGAGILSDNAKASNFLGTETDLGLNGSAGELFIGYSTMWTNSLYTGAEIFGQLSSNKGNFAGYQYKQESYYGVRVMPGFKIANSAILFGNIGYVRTRFSSPFTSRNNLDGLQVGAGLQTMITCNASIRGGWNWNQFSSPNDFNGKLRNNQFYIDAIYHFMA